MQTVTIKLFAQIWTERNDMEVFICKFAYISCATTHRIHFSEYTKITL